MSTRTQMLAAMFGSGGPKDDEWENVALLLNAETGDPANGAQNSTFLDSSSNSITITEGSTSGNPYSQNSVGPFLDHWAVSKGSTNNGRYRMANGVDLVSASGDFTVEAWVVSDGSANALFAVNAASFPALMVFGTGSIYASSSGSSWDVYSNQSTTSIGDLLWHHFALVRDGTTFAVFVDGTRYIYNASFSASLNTPSGGVDLFSHNGSSAWGTNGSPLISNLRVTNTVVYDPTVSSLTVPSGPLTAISGTQILTCASAKFEDLSSNGYTPTFGTGDVYCVPQSPFPATTEYNKSTLGGSAFSDNTQASIHYTSGTAVGTTNFTIEGFYYFSILSDYRYSTLFSLNENGAYGVFVQHDNVTGQTNLYVSSNGSSYDIFSAQNLGFTLVVGQWQHHALVRDGTTWSYYVDGSRVWTATASATLATGSQNSAIGGRRQDGGGSGQQMRGYVANFRFSLTARYSGTSLTVPTAPFSSDGNTQLLCLFANGGILDAATKVPLVPIEDAEISTAQAGIGTRSIIFDGTGDYLFMPALAALELGRDFTIEFMLRPAAANGAPLRLQHQLNGYAAQAIYLDPSWNLQFYSSSTGTTWDIASAVSIAPTMTANVWAWVAITRSGNTYSTYVGGVRTATFSNSSTPISGNPSAIGADFTGATNYNGYIDQLRITKGVARYTGASYVVPTEQYPTRG